MECYRQYIDHLKSGFSYVSAQSFNEGVIDMGITNDKPDQERNKREGRREVSPALS